MSAKTWPITNPYQHAEKAELFDKATQLLQTISPEGVESRLYAQRGPNVSMADIVEIVKRADEEIPPQTWFVKLARSGRIQSLRTLEGLEPGDNLDDFQKVTVRPRHKPHVGQHGQELAAVALTQTH